MGGVKLLVWEKLTGIFSSPTDPELTQNGETLTPTDNWTSGYYKSSKDTTTNRRKEMNNFISYLKTGKRPTNTGDGHSGFSPLDFCYYFCSFDIPNPGTYTLSGNVSGTIEITESGKWYEFPTI